MAETGSICQTGCVARINPLILCVDNSVRRHHVILNHGFEECFFSYSYRILFSELIFCHTPVSNILYSSFVPLVMQKYLYVVEIILYFFLFWILKLKILALENFEMVFKCDMRCIIQSVHSM